MIGSVSDNFAGFSAIRGSRDLGFSSSLGLFSAGLMTSSVVFICMRLVVRRFKLGDFSPTAATFLGDDYFISVITSGMMAIASDLTSVGYLRIAGLDFSSVDLPCSLQARQNHLSLAFFFMSNFLSAL